MLLFFSTVDDNYRKPYIGIWNFIKDELYKDKEISIKNSFYVGDAAGRPKGPKKIRKDFSSSDR